jgi:uncharacterized protein involved in outer membrane biogenesis
VPKTAVIDRGAAEPPAHTFKRWLFAGLKVKGTQGPVYLAIKFLDARTEASHITSGMTSSSSLRPAFSEVTSKTPTTDKSSTNRNRGSHKSSVKMNSLNDSTNESLKADFVLFDRKFSFLEVFP